MELSSPSAPRSATAPGGSAPERSASADQGIRQTYTPVAIGFHWLVAALLLGQLAFGWFLTTIPRGTPDRGFYVNLHKSTGLIILAMILLRVLWRLFHSPPRLPSFMRAWERAAARGNHIALYVLMLVMPLSGYIASNFSKYGIKFFNAVKLPPWGIDDHRIYGLFNSTHIVTAYVFAAIIAIHVLAALRHALRRDGVFSRMLG